MPVTCVLRTARHNPMRMALGLVAATPSTSFIHSTPYQHLSTAWNGREGYLQPIWHACCHW